MTKRWFLLGLAPVLAGALATPASVHARDLTVTAWGGSTQAAQRKVYYEPFMAASGIKLLEDSWSGGIGVLRTKVSGGNANWDVVQVEVDELVLGCEEGLFEELDWKALGGREQFLPGAAHDCGVGSVVWSTGLVYDGAKFNDGPKTWADFWDVKRFPGKRSLRKGAKYTLEFALMADGVAPADVYKVLRTREGVDRAFRKLDELKPHIVWWTSGAQPLQLLASGEIAMAGAYFSRFNSANKTDNRDFEVVWPGSIYAIDYWVLLQGTPHRDDGMRFIAFATRADNQKQFPPLAFQGVTNVAAVRGPDANAGRDLPTYPANMSQALALDGEFWVENNDQLNQRFNAWASR